MQGREMSAEGGEAPRFAGIAAEFLGRHPLVPGMGAAEVARRLKPAIAFVESLEADGVRAQTVAANRHFLEREGRGADAFNDVDRARVAISHVRLQVDAQHHLDSLAAGVRSDGKSHRPAFGRVLDGSYVDLQRSAEGRFGELSDARARREASGGLALAERRFQTDMDAELHRLNGSYIEERGLRASARRLIGGVEPEVDDKRIRAMEVRADTMEVGMRAEREARQREAFERSLPCENTPEARAAWIRDAMRDPQIESPRPVTPTMDDQARAADGRRAEVQVREPMVARGAAAAMAAGRALER